MNEARACCINEVDLVQTEAHPDDQGTLYIGMSVDQRDVVRVYPNFPVSLYEEWMESDFDEALYLAEIESVYPFVEEDDDNE